jgi:hypothetical protein
MGAQAIYRIFKDILPARWAATKGPREPTGGRHSNFPECEAASEACIIYSFVNAAHLPTATEAVRL